MKNGFTKLFSSFDFRFFAFYLFLFLFPHYLARDISSIILLTLVYILVICIFKRFSDLSVPEILFYVILALSFTGLHFLNNREYGPVGLGQSMARKIGGPWIYRILIPEAMNLIRGIYNVPEVSLRAAFGFFFFVMSFLSTYLLLSRTLQIKRELAFVFPLLYVFMIPFSWDLLYVTDFPEIFFSIIFLFGVMANRKWLVVASFLLGMLNRDSTAIFGLLFYFFYLIQSEKHIFKYDLKSIKKKIWERKNEIALIVGLLFAYVIVKGILTLTYGESNWIENHFPENIKPLADYWNYLCGGGAWRIEDFSRVPRLLSFAGGIYILLFIFYRNIDRRFLFALIGATIIFTVPFVRFSNINETRTLYVLLPYILYGLANIFSKKTNDLERSIYNFSQLLYVLVSAGLILALLLLSNLLGVWYKNVRVPECYKYDYESGTLQGFREEKRDGKTDISVTNKEKFSGKYTVKLNANSSFSMDEIRINVPVKADTNYLLEGYFKTEGLTYECQNPMVGIFYGLEFEYEKRLQPGDNGDDIVGHRDQGVLTGDNDWKKVSYRFRTHVGTEMMRIGIGFGNGRGGKGTIYADEISLREVKGP